jgi:hypothetical protein
LLAPHRLLNIWSLPEAAGVAEVVAEVVVLAVFDRPQRLLSQQAPRSR